MRKIILPFYWCGPIIICVSLRLNPSRNITSSLFRAPGQNAFILDVTNKRRKFLCDRDVCLKIFQQFLHFNSVNLCMLSHSTYILFQMWCEWYIVVNVCNEFDIIKTYIHISHSLSLLLSLSFLCNFALFASSFDSRGNMYIDK